MNLFTVSTFRYPKHIETTFQQYTYFYEHINTYQSFFQENKIDNCDISFNEILSIENGVLKE